MKFLKHGMIDEFKEFREEAVAKLQQYIDLLEVQDQKILPVEAKVRQVGSQSQC